MPLDDPKAFEAWLEERWREKDRLLEHYVQNGRFPTDDGLIPDGDRHDSVHENGTASSKSAKPVGYIETEVKPASHLELLQIFVPFAAMLLILNVAFKMWNFVVHGRFGGLA